MRRNIQKLIRFSEEEWNDVERRAKAAGMKPAVFVRNISSRGQIKIYDLDEYQSMSYPMRGIWNEMNQIAKVANSTHSVYEKDVSELKAETERLKMLFDDYFSGLKYTTA